MYAFTDPGVSVQKSDRAREAASMRESCVHRVRSTERERRVGGRESERLDEIEGGGRQCLGER